ncbi:MAG: glycosyltransferase [Candidatus Scalindua sp. AMX11]|nr:MAG: glycosyltransferase [Candidatus Scalindua sp.]TDE64809.1 MAG: glycosyltransferase [Candidatus Scalindua sp. AMX11]
MTAPLKDRRVMFINRSNCHDRNLTEEFRFIFDLIHRSSVPVFRHLDSVIQRKYLKFKKFIIEFTYNIQFIILIQNRNAYMKSSNGKGLKIGIIASMKNGLEHFIYREIVYLARYGASISLFSTKFNLGLYNAHEEWALHKWNPIYVILMQPYFFIKSPVKYLKILWEALLYKSFIDFAIAFYFSDKMKQLDIIYSTFGDRKFFIGYFCKQILNKPLVVTIHAYELYQNPNPLLFKHALSSCNQIITVSDFNREYISKHFNIEPSQIEVIRYSVDIDEYKPKKKFTILIVGFFVKRKGHDILFKAVKQLNNDDFEIWVVGGDGSERSVNVKQMVLDLGIEQQVAFFGKLSGTALKALYRTCNVFCLPCRVDDSGVAEGFPNVLIEAMACGKPVITTRHVEIPRIIPEILVNENDVEGLAQAISQVYNSESLCRRLGKQNRQIAIDTFSPRNTVRTMNVLTRLCK